MGASNVAKPALHAGKRADANLVVGSGEPSSGRMPICFG